MHIATPEDLRAYMGQDIDETRALLFISLAEAQCESYVCPLPDSALGIVLKLAAQGVMNPTVVQTETAGPFSYGMPSSSQVGLTLSRADIRQLRLLAGRGSVFTIDPTPADAGTALPPWDTNVTWADGIPGATDGSRG